MSATAGKLTNASGVNFRELEQKRVELGRLQNLLAEKELELSTRRAQLHLFERRYHQRVGTKYAELEEIKVKILDLAANVFPQKEEFRASAESAREQARHSAEEAQDGIEAPAEETFAPSEDLRKLYRDVAKKIHPDLTTDADERERRHLLMARLNKAYDETDAEKIRDVLREWEEGQPEEGGVNLGTQLVKILRKISQVRQRMVNIEGEIERLENSETSKLKEKIEQAETAGRDILAEMAHEVDEKIESMQFRVRRLAFDVTQI
jgi:hypothetical protein